MPQKSERAARQRPSLQLGRHVVSERRKDKATAPDLQQLRAVEAQAARQEALRLLAEAADDAGPVAPHSIALAMHYVGRSQVAGRARQ